MPSRSANYSTPSSGRVGPSLFLSGDSVIVVPFVRAYKTTAEELRSAGETFDIILNMEVVEHVADVDAYLTECSAMVRPGGLMFVATINRTLKALALAIVGAEYILRWLPRGTHQYDKLVRLDEVRDPVVRSGLAIIDETGVVYNPLSDQWRLSEDMDVNYMMLAARDTASA